MRSLSLGVLALVVSVAGGAFGGGGKNDVAGDLKNLQGTWRFTALTTIGTIKNADKQSDFKIEQPKSQLAKMTITFTAEKWVVRDGDMLVQAGTCKIDPTKSPPQYDGTITEGDLKGNTMLGIYELTGNTVRFCYDPLGKARPTSFTPKTGETSARLER